MRETTIEVKPYKEGWLAYVYTANGMHITAAYTRNREYALVKLESLICNEMVEYKIHKRQLKILNVYDTLMQTYQEWLTLIQRAKKEQVSKLIRREASDCDKGTAADSGRSVSLCTRESEKSEGLP